MSKRKFDGKISRPINKPDKNSLFNGSSSLLQPFNNNVLKPWQMQSFPSASNSTDPVYNDLVNSLNGPSNSGFGGAGFSSGFHNSYSNGRANSSYDVRDALGGFMASIKGAQNNLDGNFLDFISGLINNNNIGQDVGKMIIEQMLQYGFTNDQRKYDQQLTNDQRAYEQSQIQDQRSYDWSLTENQRAYDRNLQLDQRLYDSPTNQLARLMGAGISRDAAIQMLSGGSSGVGVSGGSPVSGGSVFSGSPVSNGLPSGSGISNGFGELQTAQTVIQAIQTVGNLVSQGFDMYSAVQQARALSMQNTMSSEQLDAFNSVNQITAYLQDGVTQGILTPEDLNSWKNANDVYTWLNDHQDTNFVKPLVQSGAFRKTFGSTLGRELFNHHWAQVQESKSAGDVYDSFVRQQEAAARLASFNAEKSYFDVQYAIGELSRQDVEIQNLWNDVWSGNIDIQIKGEQLKREKFETNQASTRNDIFNAVYNGSNDGVLPDLRGLGRGARYVAFSQFDELSRMFHKAYALSGTQERQDTWEKFYRDNADAAMLMAGIQLHLTRKQSEYVDPKQSPYLSSLIQLYQIGQLTGAFDILKTSGQVAAEAALIFK